MSDFDIYKVNLDTPQPNSRLGESPRAAFNKYNDALDAINDAIVGSGQGQVISATEPDITAAYMVWIDISSQPEITKVRNADNDDWVTIGETLLPLGNLAYKDIAPLDKGGTGADSAADARTNLGLGSAAVEDIIPKSKGGTGAALTTNLNTFSTLSNGGWPLGAGASGNGFFFNSPVSAISTRASATTSLYIGASGSGQSSTLVSFLDTVPLPSSATFVGSITHNGSVTSYNTSSDHRLKTNINDADINASNLISAIRVREVDWKNTDYHSVCFVAHEVQEVIPDMVTGVKDAVDDNGDPVYQQVDYSKLVPYLVKALQEHQSMIRDLESRLDVMTG